MKRTKQATAYLGENRSIYIHDVAKLDKGFNAVLSIETYRDNDAILTEQALSKVILNFASSESITRAIDELTKLNREFSRVEQASIILSKYSSR